MMLHASAKIDRPEIAKSRAADCDFWERDVDGRALNFPNSYAAITRAYRVITLPCQGILWRGRWG